MKSQVAIDAGPLVALIDRADSNHVMTRNRFANISSPVLTVEPALTEAAHLVRKVPNGIASLMGLLRDGFLSIPLRLQDETAAIERLVRKYENVPMSVADAALVRLLELTPKARLLTFDSDFRSYRLHGRRVVPLLD